MKNIINQTNIWTFKTHLTEHEKRWNKNLTVGTAPTVHTVWVRVRVALQTWRSHLSINEAAKSTIRPAGGANVLNPSRFVAAAASIISPRSGAREYKRRRGAKSPWGWSAASDSGLFRHTFSAHCCSEFVCPDNSLSVRKQDPLRGAAACRWLKLFPVQTSSPEEETTMYHEETSTLPKPHYGSE